VGKKKSTTIEITPPGEEEVTTEELVELNQTEGGELFRVTDELRATQGVRLMFVRTYPAGPDSAGYVGEMGPGEFTTDRVREMYGPGKYKVTILGPKGILPGGGTITIAKGVDKPKTEGVGNIAELLRVLEERQEKQRASNSATWNKIAELAIPGMFTVLAALVSKGGGNQTDVAALITALKPAPQPSIGELTTALAGIQSLQGKPASELGGLEGLLKAATLLKEFAGEGGGDKGGSNWLDVLREALKEAIPMARPVLEQAAANAAARMSAAQVVIPTPVAAPPAAPRPVIAAPVTAAPVRQAPTAPVAAAAPPLNIKPTITEGEDMWQMAKPIIKDQVEKLIRWASEKKEPGLYAEVFVTELPQVVASYVSPQQALTWLQHPDWWKVVRGQYPELEPHFIWLDQFRSELILLVEEQVAEATQNEQA
jgi:hypothetical protein